MQSASGGNGVTGEIDNTPTFGEGGIDEDGTVDPDAKGIGNRSIWEY